MQSTPQTAASRTAPLGSLLCLAGLMLCVGWLTGAAGTQEFSLSGRWSLDLEASDPVGPLLARFGVDRVSRAIAEKTVVSQVITQSGDSITIEFDSPWLTSKRTIPVDGSLAPDIDPAGRPSKSRSTWGDDRRSVVSRSAVVLADGIPAQLVVERTRPTPDQMVITSVLTAPDREALTLRRVFALAQ